MPGPTRIKSDANSVFALRRGLSVLDAFSGNRTDLGVNEIARMVGMHKSTVSRLCSTLESAGYLQRDPATNRFSLGARIFQLTGSPNGALDLREIARPELLELVERCRETATLAIRDRRDITTIDVVDGLDFVRMQARVGTRTQVHASAVAKAILAYISEAELHEMLDAWPMGHLTPNTITSKRELVKQLPEIRARGYSIDIEEMEVGLRCVGAPIRDHTGNVTAAISISGPRHRMTEEAIAALGPVARATADRISARLGAPRVEDLPLEQLPRPARGAADQ